MRHNAYVRYPHPPVKRRPPPLAAPADARPARHQHKGRCHNHEDDAEKQSRERVDLRASRRAARSKRPPSAGSSRRAGDKARDHQIVERQRERQEPARDQRRADPRQGDARQHRPGTRAEIERGLFEARSKPASWARTSTDTKQAPNVACAIVIVSMPRLGQPNQLCAGDKQQQQREAEDHLRHDQRREQHEPEHEPAGKAREPRHAKPGASAEHQREGGRHRPRLRGWSAPRRETSRHRTARHTSGSRTRPRP